MRADETKRATLAEIAAARRRGRASRSARARRVEAVAPYLDDLYVVMVMTVEPGFGGQRFMAEPAAKIADAKRMLARRARARPVHVDGGVSADTARIRRRLGRRRVRCWLGALPARP